MSVSPKRVRLILTPEKNRVGRRKSTTTSDTAIECLKELNELKNLQIQTLTQEVSEFQERAAQWEQEKAKFLGEILSLERKIESLEQDLEEEITASAITANGRDAENKTLAKEVASLNEIVQAKCQMLDVWASLGARWDNDKAVLEHHVRSSESEVRRLSTSPGARAILDVAATPIDPEEPSFLKASPVPPRPETAVATPHLPAPPRLSLLQRTRLTSNLEIPSKSPDATFSSQAISPSSSTQTIEALSDSTPKLLNETHTETGLGEASSMDCDRDTMNPDAVHARVIQQQNSVIGTGVDFSIDSTVGAPFSSTGWQVALERGLVAAPSESAASGNIQPPPGAKRRGRPKGSKNKKKMDVDLDLDFLDASLSSLSTDAAFSRLGEDLNFSAPSASAVASGSIQPPVAKRIGRPKGSKNKNKADKKLPVFGPARKCGQPLRYRHSPAPTSASMAANETQKRKPGRPRKYPRPLMATGPETTNVANSQGPLPAPTTYSVPPLHASSAISSTPSSSTPTLSLDTLIVSQGPNVLDAADVALIPTDGTLKRKRGRPCKYDLPLMPPESESTDVASSQGPLPAPTTVSVPLLLASTDSFPTPTLTLDAPIVPPAVYRKIS